MTNLNEQTLKKLLCLLDVLGNEENSSVDDKDGDIRIAVLQRGWVFIGRWESHGDEIFLKNAYCIRRWGTTEGLGELARKGKLEETILDKAKDVVRFNKLSCIFSIPCEESKWKHLI